MAKNLHTDNNIIKFTGTDKTDYKVPDFLIKNFENIPGKNEFYEAYAPTGEEIPLWWTRDVDLPLTRKENKKASKKAAAIKTALEIQRKKTQEANRIFLKIIEKQQKEYQKRCLMLDNQIASKIEELDFLNQKNQSEFNNKLFELELDIQNNNLDKDFYEKEKEKLSELERITKSLTLEQQEREQILAALDEQIIEEKEKIIELKTQVNQQREKKGFSSVVSPSEKAKKEQEINKVPVNIDIESFNEKNIMEVKYLTLFNRETGKTELNNINFDIKKEGVTVIYSAFESVINNIHSAVMKNLPSNIQRTKGDIRILGQSITELLREEYKNKIKKSITYQVDIEDTLAKTDKKVISLFKYYKISSKSIPELIKAFDIDNKILNKRTSNLNSNERKKLALAISVFIDMPLRILYQPTEDLTDKDTKKFIKILNTQKISGALIIFSTDKSLSANIVNTALYSIK